MHTENEKIMVFGVFDNLHDGHRFLLEKALKYGSNLYIVVTPTKTVQILKNKLPSYSIKERIDALTKEYPKARIIEGDTKLGEWTPIEKYQPTKIICGYDQADLYNELQKIQANYTFELIKIEDDHKGSELHSRIINKSV